MNIYLAIKYHADAGNRDLIESISSALTTMGHQVTCIARDVEQWGAVTLTPEALMQRSFLAIDRADLLLVEFSEKGVGLGIEAGYAHARGIPIVVMAKTGAEISTTLAGIADQVLFYDNWDSFALPILNDYTPSARRETWDYITSSVDRLLATLDDLPTDALDWQPHPNASTLTMLAVHILGNIEETVWGVICGQAVERDRDAEFAARQQDPMRIHEHWQVLRSQIEEQFSWMNSADLARLCHHPRRGPMAGHEILVVVARHAAEHLAEAELTRLLWAVRAQEVK